MDDELLLLRERSNNEGLPTSSSEAQHEIEYTLERIFRTYDNLLGLDRGPGEPHLLKEQHKDYLMYSLKNKLPESFGKLDASIPWISYWVLHSLAVLDFRIEDKDKEAVISLLNRCYHPAGGYGGGFMQYGHLAPTYAAINSLVIVGSPAVWSTVDKDSVKTFLYRLRVGDGSFYVHEGGETDIRAVYCAVVVAKILNIQAPDLFDRSVEWIVRCQTYEGGFGGNPGQEAHGGYSFCAAAALFLLQGLHLCDLKALLRWSVNRQMKFEGGFQGRTNKLVDSCYTFWQGATVVLAQIGLFGPDSKVVKEKDWFFNKKMLQEYVLMCCQDPYGGMMDKPKVRKDPYHTCYALSGLSVAQTSPEDTVGDPERNCVQQVHPAFNLPVDKLAAAMEYFYGST